MPQNTPIDANTRRIVSASHVQRFYTSPKSSAGQTSAWSKSIIAHAPELGRRAVTTSNSLSALSYFAPQNLPHARLIPDQKHPCNPSAGLGGQQTITSCRLASIKTLLRILRDSLECRCQCRRSGIFRLNIFTSFRKIRRLIANRSSPDCVPEITRVQLSLIANPFSANRIAGANHVGTK